MGLHGGSTEKKGGIWEEEIPVDIPSQTSLPRAMRSCFSQLVAYIAAFSWSFILEGYDHGYQTNVMIPGQSTPSLKTIAF